MPKALKIDIINLQSEHRINRPLLRKILLRTMKEAGIEDTLSFAVVDTEEITELNRRFLGRAERTDVLSFPMQDDCQSGMFGEVVVCADVAAEEADKRGISFDAELALYALHGLLHLLGFDDGTPENRRLMVERQREILAEFGLPGP